MVVRVKIDMIWRLNWEFGKAKKKAAELGFLLLRIWEERTLRIENRDSRADQISSLAK
jgi:hypothetical protein